ncbi:hypothetical protein BB561_001224 [Smittium simulii]|uniref:Kri1-like C-terminal domain-containing protein n=1 Tax=Smittium simulii TaxID=133385 RepID=A0A2T9YVK6_9FUNG|nr:hypothetical protein BB561_001224 [Smittium simulii]
MSEFSFSINKSFAKEYEAKKKHEELTLLKEKYSDADKIDELKLLKAAARQKRSGKIGSSVMDFLSDSDDESSSSDEEDEVGELATPQIDVQIFKTILAIKNKDKTLYDQSSNFYSDKDILEAELKWKDKQQVVKKQKPVTIKDYQRQVLLEDGGIIDEEKEFLKEKKTLTHVQEQQEIKDSFKVIQNLKCFYEGEEDQENSGLFVVRDKTQDELDDDQDQYKAFLLENVAKGKDVAQSMDELDFFKDNKNDPKNVFLMDYILNRKWIEKPEKSSVSHNNDTLIDDQVDDINDYLAETYESQYSYRFQEP